jgi:hypothetical protein
VWEEHAEGGAGGGVGWRGQGGRGASSWVGSAVGGRGVGYAGAAAMLAGRVRGVRELMGKGEVIGRSSGEGGFKGVGRGRGGGGGGGGSVHGGRALTRMQMHHLSKNTGVARMWDSVPQL